MTRDMPRESWRDELDSFNRQHQGWLVSVTTRRPDGQTLVEARDMPLQGVSQMSSTASDLAVEVGDRERHLTHEVREITALKMDVTDAGADKSLIIESADRTTTMVTFRSPMRPEDVDGVPFSRRE
jgi:hypothetical protein